MANKTLPIGQKYLKFFLLNTESRHLLLQGSRRSGKTWAVLRWLTFISSGRDIEDNLVVCATYPALQNTIKDFTGSTGYQVTNSVMDGWNCRLPNGSVFRFKAFDDYTKAQGTSCTNLFIDEALNVPEEVITTLAMSASKQIFFSYNPTKSSHINKYINKEKSNFLKTTYLDNPHLPKEQIEEFEAIRDRAKRPTATQLDRYAYEVYVMGDFSNLSGKVFKEIHECTPEEYKDVKAKEFYGMDFGFVDNRDKTTLIGVKIDGKILYIHQYIYSDVLTSDYYLAVAVHDSGLTCYDTIFCDYGGLGKTRIDNLITASNGEWTDERVSRGFSCCNALKGQIIDGIRRMIQFDKIYVTSTSHALREEMDNYELDFNGKPVSKNDHGVDAARYAVNSAVGGNLIAE